MVPYLRKSDLRIFERSGNAAARQVSFAICPQAYSSEILMDPAGDLTKAGLLTLLV
jgi:hypothetical protein